MRMAQGRRDRIELYRRHQTVLITYKYMDGSVRWNKVLYWLVLCQLDTAGVITKKGASVEEMPP